LLLERGVVVTYETIRCWCGKFGARFAQCARAARRKSGSTWHLDEMFVTLRGVPYLLQPPANPAARTPDVRLSRCASHAGVSFVLRPDPAALRVAQTPDERGMSSNRAPETFRDVAWLDCHCRKR